jgi:GNAT superfamily N-acetyltransferase
MLADWWAAEIGMMVDSKWRDQGVGTALVQACI